jgi:hypothetical protein
MYDWVDDFKDQLALSYPQTAKLVDSANVHDVMDVLLMECSSVRNFS